MRSLTSKEELIYNQILKNNNLEEYKGIKKFSLMKGSKKYSASDPVVYNVPNTETYVIFGDLRLEFDIETLKEQLSKFNLENEKNIEEEKQIEIDMDKINEEDVEAIIEQVGCTRDEAIKALAKSDYDLVNALLEINNK